MGDRWAILVGIEKYLHPELGPVPFAEADATAVAAALATAGYPTARQIVLRGPHATRAAISSRLRRLRKSMRRGDEVLAFWAGRAVTLNDRGFLPCWDALPDDLPETSLSVSDYVDALAGSKAAQVLFLFAASGDANAQLSGGELDRLFADSPKAVALTASSPNEPILSAASHGLWSQLLVEALSGKARAAAGKDGRLTALSLQRFIEDELPRRLRKHFEAGVRQTPQIYGAHNAAAIIAALAIARLDGDAVLDLDRLRRVVFRSESNTRVKDLKDFRKSYQMPNNSGPSARKFVARIAAADIRADLDRVHDSAREALGYRRKDFDLTVAQDGSGTLRTPDFEYAVYVGLDPDDPTRVTWRREAGQFQDAQFVRGPRFDAVFGPAFDQLVFEFTRPVDVARFVDGIEDNPPPGRRVSASSDGNACDVALDGYTGSVTIQRHSLTVRGRSAGTAGLLDLFLHFLRTVGSPGDPPALAAKPAH